MKDINFLKENLIAHRGYHNKDAGIPENSKVAFKRAVENNYIIELDVHILKDNKIIVFHDDNTSRMTGINKNLRDCTYEEIKKLKLNNTNYTIPLFEEVLKEVDGKVPIIIELKTDNKVGKLESELVKILKTYNGKFVVKSFNPLSVYWFKKHAPNIIRGQLASNFPNDKMSSLRRFILKNLYLNFINKPDFVSYDIGALPNKRVEKYRKKHIVLGWTVRNKKDYEKGKKYCDNLICENFDKLEV